MENGATQPQRVQSEEEVWNAISAFEQILEAMPNDRAALETLTDAYEQIGDHTRARDYLVRLVETMLAEGDAAGAAARRAKLQSMAAEDAEIAALLERLDSAAATSAAATRDSEASRGASPGDDQGRKAAVSTTFNVAEELSLAWNLMEAGELTQDEYAGIVQDLTEMTAGSSLMTISVLHVMEARGFKNLERVMGVLARESGVPIISLSSFDFNFDAACLLPLDFMVRRGAVVFECLGQDALVAVLNPYDKQLRRDAQTLCARRCHFYLVLSSEFDRYVHRCKDLLDAKAAQEDAEPGGAAAAGER